MFKYWDVFIYIVRMGPSMAAERSCGAVVFTRVDGECRFVIIESRKGKFGFPKGHMEGSETELETARREIMEEVSLDPVFIDGFRTESHYILPEKKVPKTVVYFLAEYADQVPKALESEVNSVRLLDYDEAMDVLQFEANRRILTEARDFIQGM